MSRNAILALVDYCGEEEGLRNNFVDQKLILPPIEFKMPIPRKQQLEEINKSVLVSAMGGM